MSQKQTVNPEVELGSASLMPLIAKYAIPSIISMLVGALYNLTDQIFIGRIVGVVGIAQGCQPIWGYNLGAKNYRRVKGTYYRDF